MHKKYVGEFDTMNLFKKTSCWGSVCLIF